MNDFPQERRKNTKYDKQKSGLCVSLFSDSNSGQAKKQNNERYNNDKKRWILIQ